MMVLRPQRFVTYIARRKLSLIVSAVLAVCTVLQPCAMADAVSIKHSEYLPFEGAKLYLLIHGEDRSAPVLLWLHGGPGGAERPLFRYFNSDFEKYFVVVYWDQRGAGRSFDPKADPHHLTIFQHPADLNAVVDYLRRSLGPDKVVLVACRRVTITRLLASKLSWPLAARSCSPSNSIPTYAASPSPVLCPRDMCFAPS